MRFIWKRLGQLVVVLFAVTFLSSLLLSLLPGDAAIVVCGASCTEEQYEQVRTDMGLDEPVTVRYVQWLNKALHGDLGRSNINGEEVSTALKQRLPVTIELLIFSQVIALLIAVPLGVYSARRPNGVLDRLGTLVSFVFLGVPVFVTALVLVSLFAVRLRWFPSIYRADFLEDPVENIRSLFLPALSLALGEIAVYSRLLRADLMSTMQEDYIAMAKAKGMPEGRILWRHAFRPSTFSLMTVLGLRIGALIGGALVIEQIFVINGVGLYSISAILKRDFIPLQGAVAVIAVGYVLINFAVDLLYAVVDPRIRHARSTA